MLEPAEPGLVTPDARAEGPEPGRRRVREANDDPGCFAGQVPGLWKFLFEPAVGTRSNGLEGVHEGSGVLRAARRPHHAAPASAAKRKRATAGSRRVPLCW